MLDQVQNDRGSSPSPLCTIWYSHHLWLVLYLHNSVAASTRFHSLISIEGGKVCCVGCVGKQAAFLNPRHPCRFFLWPCSLRLYKLINKTPVRLYRTLSILRWWWLIRLHAGALPAVSCNSYTCIFYVWNSLLAAEKTDIVNVINMFNNSVSIHSYFVRLFMIPVFLNMTEPVVR